MTPPTQGEHALIEIAREIEALKRPCGTDPESAIAVQNGRYMSLSYKIRALAAQVAAQPASPVAPLTEQNAGLLDQAAMLLERYSGELDDVGADSDAMAAECSAHAVRTLANLLIGGATKTEPIPAVVLENGAESNMTGGAYAELPEPHYEHGDNPSMGEVNCDCYTADQMRAFADASHAIRASHGQAPARAAHGALAKAIAAATAQAAQATIPNAYAGRERGAYEAGWKEGYRHGAWANAAPAAGAVAGPTEQQAHDMGAKGAPATDEERALFEAWMRGHCWALSAAWTGSQYLSPLEHGGFIDPQAMSTRRLWAAWRDRAALANAPTPAAQADSGVSDAMAKAYCAAWQKSFQAANPYHSVSMGEEDLKHITAGLAAALALKADSGVQEDEALLRQLVEALENHGGNYKLTTAEAAAVQTAIDAGRAALAAKGEANG